MRQNRYLPILIPLFAGVALEVIYFWPSMIYVAAAMIIIIFLFTSRQFLRAGSKRERWWDISILPVIFTSGLIVFSVILPKSWVQPMFLVNVIFLYLYFRTLYYHLSPAGKRNNNESLLNLSLYGNFLAVYFISSSIYGLQAFLGVSVWLLILAMFVVVELVVYQVFWANGIDLRRGALFILISGFILAELGWTVSFLPLSYYILGLIMTVCYYMLIGLARFYLSGALTAKTVKKYLIFGFLSLVVVLLSVRWL